MKTKKLRDFTLSELTQKYGKSEALKIWDSLQQIESMPISVSQVTLSGTKDNGERVTFNNKKIS